MNDTNISFTGGVTMRKLFLTFGTLFLFCLSLQASASAEEKVVASIGDQKITLSDFTRLTGYLDKDKQEMLEKNPSLKESLLRQIVQSIVISDIAIQKGFAEKPDIKEQLDYFRKSFLANEYLRQDISQKAMVSEGDTMSYYETHETEFEVPEMVRARHILIKAPSSASEDEKKTAYEKAQNILERIHAGEDFAQIASEMSDDSHTKSKGGDLGFFARGRIVKPIEDAAFSTEPGKVSGIVETQFGYHILKVEEKKDPAIQPYEEVKEKIRESLLQEQQKTKMTEFLEKAMKDANVQMHPELLTKTE
jgi:peptidyl-prolyl cis-trans isomerase C